jgi:dTDP-4-dehydrorhamnose 3,5-epimerase
MTTPKDILETMLAAAVQDKPTIKSDGTLKQRLPHGAKIHRRPVHVDDRGELQEIYVAAWDMDDVPVSNLYFVTLRPNVAKGWSLHKTHTDRYFVIAGFMQVVMFDPRPESPTCGEVFSVTMSERDRFVLSIPEFVWHADYNCGSTDVILLNFPTRPYDKSDPDKYRLPIDTPLIPYRFPATARGY